jgi:hypothetical protein
MTAAAGSDDTFKGRGLPFSSVKVLDPVEIARY